VRRLTLPEYATRAYQPLPVEQAAALAATGAVRVATDLAGRTMLSASSNVGTIRAGEVELRVTPKLGIRRLLWLIGHAQDQTGWRDDEVVQLAAADDLVAAVAVSFQAAANRALAAGVLQGYRITDEALPVLRGRLREADQLRGRLGLAVPLEVRYDDYTVDIPENQLLLAAALRLLRVPDLPRPTHTGLRRQVALLSDVSLLVPGQRLPATRDDRLTRRYQPALRLARLVLTGRSIEQPAGPVVASGFLFDLNKVFEDWLTAALRTALTPYGGLLRAQRPVHLDIDRQIDMKPDMVWERAGRPVAVIDAKYKALRPDQYPHADLYQMLAYCTALGLLAGHLVYAKGEAAPTHHVIRRSGIRVTVWAVDLSSPVPELLEQANAVASAVAIDAGTNE
jgi:5-methylcytosine-specific restriction enzyme subunit McrC